MPKRNHEADPLRRQGLKALKRGQVDEAVELLSKHLDQGAHDPEACAALGLALARLGRLTQAVAWLNEALAVRPQSAPFHYYRGRILARAGRLEEALRDFEKVVKYEPGHAKAARRIRQLHARLPAEVEFHGSFNPAAAPQRPTPDDEASSAEHPAAGAPAADAPAPPAAAPRPALPAPPVQVPYAPGVAPPPGLRQEPLPVVPAAATGDVYPLQADPVQPRPRPARPRLPRIFHDPAPRRAWLPPVLALVGGVTILGASAAALYYSLAREPETLESFALLEGGFEAVLEGQKTPTAKLLADLKAPAPLRRREACERLALRPPDVHRQEVVEALTPLLQDPEGFTREASIRAMGTWAGPEGENLLLDRLSDDFTPARRAALAALGRYPTPRVAEAVAHHLTLPAYADVARQVLVRMGPVAEAPTCQVARDHNDTATRLEACRVLGAIGTAGSVATLNQLRDAGNPEVRNAAEEALKEAARRH